MPPGSKAAPRPGREVFTGWAAVTVPTRSRTTVVVESNAPLLADTPTISTAAARPAAKPATVAVTGERDTGRMVEEAAVPARLPDHGVSLRPGLSEPRLARETPPRRATRARTRWRHRATRRRGHRPCARRARRRSP